MKNWRKIFTWLGLALWLIPGMAFAESPIESLTSFDIFTPPGGDLSMKYLGQLFGTVGTVIHGTSGQLLAELFRVFNYAMVIVASSFLIYTVFMSIVNTAQEGEFMGRKVNSAWMIVRSITGIGILVPKATGYSLIQVFFMWVVVQGIGLADKAWAHALDYLTNGGVVYTQPATFNNSGMSATFSKSVEILKSEVCMYKLQALKRQDRDNALTALRQDPANTTLKAITEQPYPNFHPVWDTTAKTVSFGYASSDSATQSICGKYSYQQATSNTSVPKSGMDASFEDYKKVGLEQIINDVTPVAKNWVDLSGQSLTETQKNIMMTRVVNALVGASADYENIMRPALNKLNSANKETWKNELVEAKQKGWIVAGAYYWNIAKIKSNENKLNNYQPQGAGFSVDALNKAGENGKAISDTLTGLNNVVDLDKLKTAVTNLANGAEVSQINGVDSTLASAFAQTGRDQAGADLAQSLGGYKPENAFRTSTVAVTSTASSALTAAMIFNPATAGLAFVPATGVAILGTWYGTMNKPGDPVAMAQDLGQGLIGIATTMWIGGGTAIAAATYIPSSGAALQGGAYAIQNALKLMVPIITAVIGALYVTGMTLAVYVPLIPFMIFTFAAIGWLISILEALIAAVLVPIGMVHLEGHDFLGKAEQTAMLLFGIFLRPVVMIVGFMAAIVMLRVGLNIINAGFSHAFSSAKIDGAFAGADLFGVMGLIIVYTMMTVSLINLVFNAGIVTLWRTICMYIGVSQPDASVEHAVQKVETGLHSGAQAMGDFKRSGLQGAQGAFEDHLGHGDKNKSDKPAAPKIQSA